MSNHQVFMVSTFLLSTLILSATAARLKPAAGTKPHIVMMLVDDWGWANVGYHRDPPTNEVVTPNIDNLVKQGLELDQHYLYEVYVLHHDRR